MNIADILARLPASLEWTSVFDLDGVLAFAEPAVVRAMFFLPEAQDLAPWSHVALSAGGTWLAPREGDALFSMRDGEWAGEPADGALADGALAQTFRPLLDMLGTGWPLCLGLGTMAPFPPVALSVEHHDDGLIGTALLAQPPTRAHFELLDACGVRFIDDAPRGGFHVARFANRLGTHLLSGLLAGFSRTGHCNLFFLRHADIDASLEAGLIRAGQARIAAGRRAAMLTLTRMAIAARKTMMAMTCLPPAGGSPWPYGDLVPLGLVARALAASTDEPHRAAALLVRRHLDARSEDGLWAFHAGTLTTATDSSLVLLGTDDADAVARLERFNDGTGGYLPQLDAATREPGRMARSDDSRHWCQPDLATTCLVRALRRTHGLPERTPLATLEAAFAHRSGLFFANPYLTDWVFALAIRDDPDAGPLRARLRAEVLSSMRPDFSFGRYDPALSTALAILTLAALGYRGRSLHCAQVRLLGMVEATGQWPAATPFYSTLAVGGPVVRQPGLIRSGGGWFALSLYEDSHRMIATALAALALGEASDPGLRDVPVAVDDPAPRYRCPDAAAYVERFALPPYVAGGTT